MKNKFIVLVSTITLLFLIGCGGNESNDNNKPENFSNKTETVKKTLKKGNPVKGKDLFLQTCSACHGQDGKGLPKLGKDLTTSKFAIELSDEELLDYVKKGRTPDDPLNTTGVAMPPKGGNPALTDEQIMDIIAYVRTLEKPELAK